MEDNHLLPVDNSFSSATTASNTSASTSNAEDGTSNEHLGQTSMEAPSISGTKGKKKKQTQDGRIESALQMVVNDVVEAQQKVDKMFSK